MLRIKNVKIFLCIALFLLLLITPNITDTALANSAVSSKAVFFIIYLSIILGLSLSIIIVKKAAIEPKISKIDVALILFVGFILCNRYFIQNDQGFSIRFIELLGLCFFYILCRFISISGVLFLFLAIILSGIIQVVYGAMLLSGYLPSTTSAIMGSFQNSGPYAGFLAIVGCLSFSMYLFKERLAEIAIGTDTEDNGKLTSKISKAFEYIAFCGIASTVILLPAIRSRAAWLAILAGAVFLLIYRYKHSFSPAIKIWGRAKTSLKLCLGGIALLLILLGAHSIYQLKRDSADGRLLIWKVTVNIIKENPIFGVGFDRFKAYYMNAQASWFEKTKDSAEVLVADNTYYAFNELLQLVTENGVTGFIIVFVIALSCFRVKTDPEFRLLKYISLIVIISVFTFGMFSYPMQILSIKMILVLMLALLSSLDKNKRALFNFSAVQFKHKGLMTLRLFVFCTGITLTLGIFHEIRKIRTALKNWHQALVIYDSESYQESLSWFKKTYPELKEDGDFLMNYGKALAMAGQYKNAATILNQAQNFVNTTVIQTALGDVYKALKQYKKSENAYKRAAIMTPNRFYPEYLLCKLYEETGQKEKAYHIAKELLAKEVKIPSKAIEEIKEEMKVIAARAEHASLNILDNQLIINQ